MADFHCPHRTCREAGLISDTSNDGLTATATVSQGKEFVATIGESFTPGLEGFWEGRESGADASVSNPYAGAVLVVEDSSASTTQRKVRPTVRFASLCCGAGMRSTPVWLSLLIRGPHFLPCTHV